MSTVVAQPYSTLGNGGRKLVILSNGWKVAVTKTTNQFNYYVDKNDGNGFVPLTYMSHVSILTNDIALASKGTMVYSIQGGGTTLVRAYAFDVTTVPNQNIHEQSPYLIGGGYVDSNQSAIGNVSLAINPQGTELHAAWASKNPTYPNSFNIRFTKGTINSDGSVTWGAVEQVTKINSSGFNIVNPTISVVGSIPTICAETNGFYHNASPDNSNVNTTTRAIISLVKNGTSKVYTSVENGWTLRNVDVNHTSHSQYSPSAVVDKDGVIANAWHGKDSTHTTIDYIRFSKSVNDVVNWSTMQKLVPGKNGTLTVDKTNKYVITYEDAGVIKRIESTNKGDTWSSPVTIGTGTNPSSLYDITLAGQFGSAPATIYQTPSSVEYIGTYTTNNAPTVTLTSPSNNQTLYENDALNITGEANDPDADQSVTAYYQINNEPRKVLATNVSQTQISLSKQLTFKGSKLYDGDTAITGTLADGVAHTLKVWAVDSEGGQSATIERTFYVVPNRAPSLSVETPTPSGIIDTDSFTINGLYEDSDGNQTTVSYRTNGSNAIQVASGVSGSFSFEVKLGSLIVGDNVITVEAVDSYGAKTTKSVKLSKSIVSAPLLTSTARYKITPPTGTASEILVWIQHDAELTLSASVSMTIAGEQESYAPMTLSNSETLQSGQVEDEFYYAADGAKDSVILRLDLTKSSVNTNEAITLITGVF